MTVPARRDDGAIRTVSPTSRHTVRGYAWDDPKRLNESVGGPFLFGLAMLALMIGGGGLWASVVPLSSGAVAPGVVVPEGQRRTVQHYEGGLVRALVVREGDQVETGAPLVILTDARRDAEREALAASRLALLAEKARLDAEASGAPAIGRVEELEATVVGRATLAAQSQIFAALRAEFAAERGVLERRLDHVAAEIEGKAAMISSYRIQLSLVGEELGIKAALKRQGLTRRTDVVGLKRNEAELVGRVGELTAAVRAGEQQQSTIRQELSALEMKRRTRIAVDLDKVGKSLRDADERLSALREVSERNIVRAPVNGRVANLKVTTIGGVVGRGEPILEIVPSEERLLVEAKISPLDIDVVHEGLTAMVMLSAYAGADAPRVPGRVVMVSADRAEPDQPGEQPHYKARVVIDPIEMQSRGHGMRLAPGMPADVIIVTGERTMLSYLLEPLKKALDRSFREAS